MRVSVKIDKENMPEITLDIREKVLKTINAQGFASNDFKFETTPDNKRYSVKWKNHLIRYEFIIYFPQVMTVNHIGIQMYQASKQPSYDAQTEIVNLEGMLSEWLISIRREISLNEMTAYNEILFSDTINSISERFQKIYNQSLDAEKFGLDEVCGMGFRKAFEFLLIDFLIYKQLISSDDAKKITALKDFISILKDEIVIHKLLSYTAWVGNEFCHYFRKHETKEISDLKEMIQIIVEWIEAKENLVQIETRSDIINSSFNK